MEGLFPVRIPDIEMGGREVSSRQKCCDIHLQSKVYMVSEKLSVSH